MAASDSRVRVISFSRNFGHEAAMIAGLDYSRGDGIICMDADLQHPRNVYRIFWLSLREGYQGYQHGPHQKQNGRVGEEHHPPPAFTGLSTGFQMYTLRQMPLTFAVSRHVAQVLKNSYREKVRFLRGYVQNVGFEENRH